MISRPGRDAMPAFRNAGDRFAELDALRGIAALWVLIFHYFLRYDQLYETRDRPLLRAPSGPLFDEGFIGLLPVCLFFMISGFVISLSLERSGTLYRFCVSRFSRLFPAYWTAAALTFAVGTLAPLPGQDYGAGQLLANLTMLQGFLYIPPIDGVYWSLAHELGFYALAAAAFSLGALKRPAWAFGAWLGLAVLIRFEPLTGPILPYRAQLAFALPFANFFLAGMIFYRIREGRARVADHILLAASAAASFLALPLSAAFIALAFWAVFAFAVAGRLQFLARRPLLFLGAISYALYLVHQMIGYRAIMSLEAAGAPPLIAVAAATALSIGLAAAITYIVERPAMRALRRRLAPKKGL
ncbi:MAG: hypothetical protein Tsb0010_17850 [Parvularculaceae bacterium]